MCVKAEDLSWSPGVLGDRGGAEVPLQIRYLEGSYPATLLKCGETRFQKNSILQV